MIQSQAYNLRYQTFDSLLESVKVDLRNLSVDTSIEPAQLIKVAQRVNYDLGVKINMVKEQVLEVCNHKAKLPDDFYIMNFALLCGAYKVVSPYPQGTQIEEVNVGQVVPTYRPWVDPKYCSDESNPPKPPCLTQCGTEYSLIQVIKYQTVEYNHFLPIKFKGSQFIDCDCPNLRWRAKDEAYIKDGWVFTNFPDGTLYINYIGAMEDADGNLLVLDHPMINEYYEYAIKKRILENLIMDNVNVAPQLQMINQELRAARNNALTICNTPSFEEMKSTWELNRKALYGKYYKMFASYPWY